MWSIRRRVLSISTNGVITWTPGAGQGHNTNTITTVVTDTGVPALSATNSFAVVVNEINVAPVLPAQANRTAVAAADPGGDQHGQRAGHAASDPGVPVGGGPTGAAIDTNGVIRWTPSVAQVPSTNVFTTVVTDTNPWAVNAQHLSATNSFTVVVNAIHNGPALPAQTNVTMAQYAPFTVTNTASDTDIPPLALTYSLVSPPSGADD